MAGTKRAGSKILAQDAEGKEWRGQRKQGRNVLDRMLGDKMEKVKMILAMGQS
jgi:hypothetical protein